jgi:pyruvate dehydrogenase E2 component (dihydrolipoamide acetyltransferase)
MGEFLMPSLGAEMEAGRLLSWYVTPGQRLRRGDIIAMIETDKANIDIEVFEDGVVEELLVEEGTRVPVGTPLARLGEPPREGEPATAASAAASPTVAEPAPTTPTTPEPTATTPEPASPAPEPARSAAAPAPPAPTAPQAPGDPAPAPPPPEPTPPTGEPPAPPETSAPAYTPVLRRLARERGVDLDTVSGTGPGGRVTRADVERAASTPTPPARARATAGHRASPYARRLAAEQGRDLTSAPGSGPDGVVVARDLAARATPTASAPPAPGRAAGEEPAADRQQAMRQAIGRAMARSKREIPHYYLGEHVDLEQTMTWLEARNADRPAAQRVLPAVLVLKAVALACVEHPDLNGFWEDDTFRPGDGIHLGVAISLRRGGLIAPAIRDVDDRSLDELMAALRDLVKRARSGGLRASELHDPTLTVTNLGDTGVETVYGVIQPPQVALVGAGAIVERPWAEDGMVGTRRCLHLTLSADHRASDGHRGALFLAAIAARLREPEKL